MKAAFRIRLRPEAEADLRRLYRGLVEHGASHSAARGYVERVVKFVAGLDAFPRRGSLRDEIRRGLRLIGFKRRVSVAFLIDDEAREVVVLRILYGGQNLDIDPE